MRGIALEARGDSSTVIRFGYLWWYVTLCLCNKDEILDNFHAFAPGDHGIGQANFHVYAKLVEVVENCTARARGNIFITGPLVKARFLILDLLTQLLQGTIA